MAEKHKVSSMYRVRRASEKLGELTALQVLNLFKDGEVFYEIEVFNSETQVWQTVAETPELNQHIAIALSSATSRPAAGYSSFSNWTLARTGKGPFNFLQIVQFLQQQKIDHSEWLIHPRMTTPEKIRDIAIFNDRNIETLYEFPLLKPLFENRKNARIDYDNRAMVYGDVDFFSGSTWSLSKEGVGVMLDTSQDFRLGAELNVHLYPNEMHEALQVQCRVVSCVNDTLSTRLGLVFEQDVPMLQSYFASRIP